MDQLHDIEGLDLISAWPLATGWWVVIITLSLAFILSTAWLIYKRAYNRGWKKFTLQKLGELEKELTPANSRETITSLSEYLRRIALKRYSREECAGLVGADWLKWLFKNDPQQFDWQTKGELLVKAPYTPLNSELPVNEIKDLIQATRYWVR